jgi:predicted RNase H-like HicB family nuclease
MHDNYPVVVFWSDEDGEFIADIPYLKYCSAGGDTPEEAVREVMIAREAWLAVARENGAVLPDPDDSRFWPDIARKQRDHQRSLTAMPPAGTEAAEVA